MSATVKKRLLGTVLPAVIFVAGLAVMLYPCVSDIWNQLRENNLMDAYDEAVAALSDDELDALWGAAVAYNAALDPQFSDAFTGEDLPSDDEYWQLLDVAGTGVMGYVEIPSIDVRLPLYHGTSAQVLEHGLGHLGGTSLPVGGAGTHCVVSGHRGLPSALLLTNLDQLAQGDTFSFHVLDRTLTYEVDQIQVVEPDEVSSLRPQTDGDFATLLTCTPYGVNTQRLLVRGHRVEGVDNTARVNSAAQLSRSLGLRGKIAITLAALLIVAVVVRLMTQRDKRESGRGGKHAR